MTTHELDLLENAVDSLAEALSKFQEGDEGNSKAYKFAVLHMAHFVELVFKNHIASKHPLLIYKNPFSAKIDQNKTITLLDAINFINNEATDTISPALTKDLEWLKRLRNEIEHHKFTMEVPEVRTTIGRLFRSVVKFLEKHTAIELESLIPESTMKTFQVLSDEYEFKLQTALNEAYAFEAANKTRHDDPDAPPPRLNCENCSNPTLIKNEQSSSGYRCLICDNEEGDNITASCDICGLLSTLGELDDWGDDGKSAYRCYYCSGRYHADKDD